VKEKNSWKGKNFLLRLKFESHSADKEMKEHPDEVLPSLFIRTGILWLLMT
jgi:hypothetical protein